MIRPTAVITLCVTGAAADELFSPVCYIDDLETDTQVSTLDRIASRIAAVLQAFIKLVGKGG